MSVDARTWNIFDKIAVGAGAVALLFSFFSSYVSVSIPSFTFGGTTVGGGSAGISAWHSWATLGMLLMLAAAALVVVRTIEPPVLPDTVPWPLVIGGGAAVGMIIVLIRGLSYSGASIGWSGWIVILAGLVLTLATIVPMTSYKSSVEEKLTNMGGGSGA